MSHVDVRSASRPQPDPELVEMANYVCDYEVDSDEAYSTARHCLVDSLACSLLALKYPDCTRLLGPLVPGAEMPGGARVPGTSFELDPVQAVRDPRERQRPDRRAARCGQAKLRLGE